MSAGKQVSRRRFSRVQELSVLVRDRVELLPLCIRKSERGGGGGERRDLLKKFAIKFENLQKKNRKHFSDR